MKRRESIPLGAQALLSAYPRYIKGYADNKLILENGVETVYDDGLDKSFQEALDNCCPADMFLEAYQRRTPPDYLSDVGRGRCEILFKTLYGSTEKEALSKLVAVKWFGETIWFTSVNGANRQLEKVARKLRWKPRLRKYLEGAQTFNWRQVRGAGRLSAHGYGIAIDINTSFSDYWLWTNPEAGELDRFSYVNRIPAEIVHVFERYGFIWGGRWYHYDTMHFEYRPELIAYSKMKKRG